MERNTSFLKTFSFPPRGSKLGYEILEILKLYPVLSANPNPEKTKQKLIFLNKKKWKEK